MQEQSQVVKSGASGTLRHPYKPPVESSRFITLCHLFLTFVVAMVLFFAAKTILFMVWGK